MKKNNMDNYLKKIKQNGMLPKHINKQNYKLELEKLLVNIFDDARSDIIHNNYYPETIDIIINRILKNNKKKLTSLISHVKISKITEEYVLTCLCLDLAQFCYDHPNKQYQKFPSPPKYTYLKLLIEYLKNNEERR